MRCQCCYEAELDKVVPPATVSAAGTAGPRAPPLQITLKLDDIHEQHAPSCVTSTQRRARLQTGMVELEAARRRKGPARPMGERSAPKNTVKRQIRTQRTAFALWPQPARKRTADNCMTSRRGRRLISRARPRPLSRELQNSTLCSRDMHQGQQGTMSV